VEQKHGVNFIRQIATLITKESVIEKNKDLQERIIAANKHFLPKFLSFQESVQNHTLITEHRETSVVINEQLNRLFLALHIQNYLLEYCALPFSVTSFLKHRIHYVQPKLKLSAYASGKKQSSSDVANPELYDTLKRWRDMICEETGLPIYMVANQNALKEIATYLPFTRKDLMQISGFGKAKSEKYGDDILDVVKDYCYKNNLESNMAGKEEHPKKERKEKALEVKTPTNIVSFNLLKEGKSIPEIAKERSLAIGTIEGHLATFVANGEVDISEIVSKDKQLLINQAVKIYGRESIKTLKDNLPEEITYGEIRMVMAAEKRVG
jgi:hypothetical protein